MIARALVSGGSAALATALVAVFAGKHFAGAPAAPLNATSHFLWGAEAGRKDAVSLRHTGLGLATHFSASVFWALFYEALPKGRARALPNGALISAAAYVTDYYIVPKRLTPGFELRLPGRALAAIYGAFALGLSVRDLLRRGAS
jgi:hypothetical protein